MIEKSLSLNLKDIDLAKREAVLAHATYKSLDKDGDRANRGMFDKSWKEKFTDLRYFYNHDRKQAPGKPLRTWDDPDHAYTLVKHGTHTLGDDTLKMLDEGIIVAVSYGFNPTKQKKIQSKGFDFFEVHHLETSVLTHWGAHDESGIVSVRKSMTAVELKDITDSIQRMEKWCRNTTASDDSIQEILKELKRAKQLIIKSDTAVTDAPLIECPRCKTMSPGIQEESGSIKCAECSYVLKHGQQIVSRNKSDEAKRKLLFLNAKFI